MSRVGRGIKELVGIKPPKPLNQTLSLVASVSMVSPVEKHLQKIAYTIIIVAWIIIVWSLLVYSMSIREMMGPEAEKDVVLSWAISLALEMFGLEAMKIIFLRLIVVYFMEYARRLFLGYRPAVLWHEKYIMAVAATRAHAEDDKGEQDLGDDADADVGDDVGDGADAGVEI
ncbi:hypothetical protein CYMTET_33476 [Cymbomonas tetramitiformis]|uniref:Uncharacterized protein n=1 Tax=Cymbomonas tetramitiformis TaxID=36881 RepID=A0AAE0KR49_9CHLO|nr:hypothetical protein CYMTET_33476 [Cymbomonas tetramitiformis]